MKVENEHHLKQGQLIAAVGHREMPWSPPGGDTDGADAVIPLLSLGGFIPHKVGLHKLPLSPRKDLNSSCLCSGIEPLYSAFLMHLCCSQSTWLHPILLGTYGKVLDGRKAFQREL